MYKIGSHLHEGVSGLTLRRIKGEGLRFLNILLREGLFMLGLSLHRPGKSMRDCSCETWLSHGCFVRQCVHMCS